MQKIFRTQINPSKFPINLNHSQSIMTMGSCFAENIGQKLSQSGFETCINPLGIYYDPFSLFNIIERVYTKESIQKSSFEKAGEIFFNWDLHTKYSGVDKESIFTDLNHDWNRFNTALAKSDFIFISLGSSIYFKRIFNQRAVANCHKQSQKLFDRTQASFDETAQILLKLYHRLIQINPNANVIFTLSPIRHIRHGFEENTLSKSILRAGIHRLVEKKGNAHYFPSFEIMMDDLRDYRFYRSDMLHPNETAIEYIWEYFQEAFFSEKTKNIMGKINHIKQKLNHTPRNPNSKAHEKFLKNLSKEINILKANYPHLILEF